MTDESTTTANRRARDEKKTAHLREIMDRYTEQFRAAGFGVFGLAAGASLSLYQADLPGPALLLEHRFERGSSAAVAAAGVEEHKMHFFHVRIVILAHYGEGNIYIHECFFHKSWERNLKGL